MQLSQLSFVANKQMYEISKFSYKVVDITPMLTIPLVIFFRKLLVYLSIAPIIIYYTFVEYMPMIVVPGDISIFVNRKPMYSSASFLELNS